jgi:hypothetical protein
VERKENDPAAPYWPYRTLTASPDVLMVLMPAELAPAFTRIVAQRYREEFGKVKGRLPLAIGNIFFPDYLPMFSVLDAAWRMVENFRVLQTGEGLDAKFDSAGLNLQLGSGGRDAFHAYAVTKERGEGGFRTPAGWVAHMEDLKEGERIQERPNIYDGVVLGGSGDRLNLHLTEKPKGESEGEWEKAFKRNGRQPVGLMFLEEFERMMDAWEALKMARAGEGAMRNWWFAMEQRRGWPADTLESLGKALARNYCGKKWTKELDDAIKSGLLRKTLLFHWSILKQRLDSSGGDEQ